MVSRSELKRAEALLRKDDKALRLRFSLEHPNQVLIERKTFRGRYGTVGPNGLEWTPDAGFRRENGHVPVASVRAEQFDLSTLRDSLRAADTWRRSVPLSRQIEERDEAQRAKTKRDRTMGLRYKASELYDRYAWRQKSRVSVPGRIAA